MSLLPSIALTVSYLEQFRPDTVSPVPSLPCVFTDRLGQEIAINHWENPAAVDYRQMYRAVGALYLWWERLLLSDDDLQVQITTPDTRLFQVSHAGSRIGYAEVVWDSAPATANIAYFGLSRGYAENGIGGQLMRTVLSHIWADTAISRVTLNTCTLDHPKALGFYQHLGFRVISTEDQTIRDPRSMPALFDVYDAV